MGHAKRNKPTEYKTVDVRTIKGVNQAERMQRAGWKIIGGSLFTSQSVRMMRRHDEFQGVAIFKTCRMPYSRMYGHTLSDGRRVVSPYTCGILTDAGKVVNLPVCKSRKSREMFLAAQLQMTINATLATMKAAKKASVR